MQWCRDAVVNPCRLALTVSRSTCPADYSHLQITCGRTVADGRGLGELKSIWA